ncbi:MAG: glutamate--tRNA ligase [Thermoplasmata archaeon HGW-Thermoplasmata-1]|nr:MAG: glutamate--tRNA ligase [Thermoplasmata archaeon HGW-Thermoplasmata-1]
MHDLEPTVRKYALQNAVQFNGRANPGAVIGKIMAEREELRANAKEAMPQINRIIAEVNGMGLEAQKAALESLAPELLERKKKARNYSLPDLPNAVDGKVVTRFPPEPNGYLHIGHAKAAIIDCEYARKYNGKFILRYDDTNPEKESKEFYEAQASDLRWLGVEWDEEYCTSSRLMRHYELAEQLISQGDAYVCSCSGDTIKGNRFDRRECACRSLPPADQMKRWKEMFLAPAGTAILRLKGDIKSNNTAMRDPTLARIIDAEHPVQGKKYRVWPTYDFVGAVEDSDSGVTHPFRTKEYELRDEVYFYVLDRLGLRKPTLMEFSRLAIEGMPVSKRLIKPLIDEGRVTGYDDPRLPTLRGLRRRGLQPEAIRQFVLTQGTSKVESTVTFDQVEAINRKLLDPKAKRFFFVPSPVRLIVHGAPNSKVTLRFHPTEELGNREIETSHVFFIPGADASALAAGTLFRLKDLYNVRVDRIEEDGTIYGSHAGEGIAPDTLKLQWVTEDHVALTVSKPGLLFVDGKYNENSAETVTGYAEKAVLCVHDEVVQFERFGFCRIESCGRQIKAFYTHK